MAVTNTFGDHELCRFNYADALSEGQVAESQFDADTLAAVDRHGFAVIENAISPEICNRLLDEMRP